MVITTPVRVLLIRPLTFHDNFVLGRRNPIWKKTTYALKTPSVVALPFNHISLLSSQVIADVVDDEGETAEKRRSHRHSLLIAPFVIFLAMHPNRGRFWAWWPWPLTYDLDLWTWPRYLHAWVTFQNSGLYTYSFGQDSETEGRTHRHTDNAKTITPAADAGCNKGLQNILP